MSDISIGNLIDLSVEELNTPPLPVLPPLPIIEQASINSNLFLNIEMNASDRRESFENNPFDKVHKLVNLSKDDPFESVSYEAEKYVTPSHVKEVRTEQLISLPEDDVGAAAAATATTGASESHDNKRIEHDNNDIIDNNDKIDSNDKIDNDIVDSTKNTLIIPNFSRTVSTISCPLSSISTSSWGTIPTPSDLVDNVFDLESPIVTKTNSKILNMAFIANENTINFNNRDESCSLLNKGFINSSTIIKVCSESGMELKNISELMEKSHNVSSITTTTTTTTTSNESSIEKSKNTKNSSNLLKLSLSNLTVSSPHYQQVKNNETSFNHIMNNNNLIVENLAKSLNIDNNSSCDDLMSTKPPSWFDSEAELDDNDESIIDKDLEMMKIPILDEIDKNMLLKEKQQKKNENNAQSPKDGDSIDKDENLVSSTVPSLTRASLDFKALKERIELEKQKHERNPSDVHELIENLKKIVFNCSNDDKKMEANALLESLSNLLENRNEDKAKETETTSPPPEQPVIRPGTFNIDNKLEDPKNCSSTEENTLNTPPPITFQAAPPDIVEQIGKLFTNDNMQMIQNNLCTNCGKNNNPTYIFALTTPTPLIRQGTQIFYTKNDGSGEFHKPAEGRSRSQSLSLHDKRSSSCSAQKKGSPSKNFITPQYNSGRRLSLASASSSVRQSNLNNVRRSIYSTKNTSCIEKNASKDNSQGAMKSKQSEIDVVDPLLKVKSVPKPESKKIKVKAIDLAPKPRGPMKAIQPIKNNPKDFVIPSSVVTSPPTTVDKKKNKPITSTPLIVPAPKKGIPNACSTPSVIKYLSPSKGTANKARGRYSYAPPSSTTPKSKLNTSNNTLPGRRSLTDFKSPKCGAGKVQEVENRKTEMKTVGNLSPDSMKINKSVKQEVGLLGKNKENKIPKSKK